MELARGRFIGRRPRLLALITLWGVAATPLMLYQPLVVKYALATDRMRRGFSYESAPALLSSVGSLGGVCGGVLVGLTGDWKRNRVAAVLAGMGIADIAQAVFGLSLWLYLSAAALFVAYAMGPVAHSLAEAIWQTDTPPETQGRVFAIRRLISQGAWPVGTLLSGWAGGVFEPGGVIVAASGLIAAICCASSLRFARIKAAEGGLMDDLR